MKKLWAPWRMEYIQEHVRQQKKKTSSHVCVFCEVIKTQPSYKNLVLYKGKLSYVIMNRYPYTNGHLMVIPYKHTDDFNELKKAEQNEMHALIDKSIRALKSLSHPHGFNIGMNIGTAGGAGIKEHLHYHVVPRWNGDNNFMPVVGDIRMIYEHMQVSYKKLKKIFSQL